MKRYQQQQILPEIGKKGQENISDAAVLVVGAGGLGTIVAGYLAAMGVGKIGICDFDSVDESNLHRQFFYSPGDIGVKKAEVLSYRLSVQNPNITILPIVERLYHSNAESIISRFHIICDCSDNVNTRLLINKQCELQKTPLVHGAVSEWQGYVTVLHYKQRFSLSDLFETNDLLNSQTCFVNGINSTVCGIIGSFMANETIKIIINLNSVLDGKLLHINGLNNATKILKLKRNV